MQLTKRILLILSLFILLFILTGCERENALTLAIAGTTTGNLISKYYEHLITFNIQTWELESFISSVRGLEFTKQQQIEYQKSIEYLKARKKMIDSLVNVYRSYEDFINDNRENNINFPFWIF